MSAQRHHALFTAHRSAKVQMNRFQKKCFIASAGFHLSLLLILVVGPGFFSGKNLVNDLPVLDYIPAIAIDAAMSGGGNPNVKQLPPPAPIRTEVQPPKPPQPRDNPAPPKIPDAKTPDRNPTADQKHKVEVSDTVVDRSKIKPPSNTSKDTSADQARARAQQLAASLRSAAQSLKKGLSPSTAVEISGTGGEAYANYDQIVKSIYTRDWIIPDDVTDNEATAKVTVVIERNGTVVSARITQSSGNAAADRSIQATLDRVRLIRPFPETTKDKERTFKLSFNVKARRLLE